MPQIKQFIACKNAKTATVKPFCEIKTSQIQRRTFIFTGILFRIGGEHGKKRTNTRMQSKISLQKQTAEI